MFILSVRMSTLKFALSIVLCLAVLVGVFVMADGNTSATDTVSALSYEGVESESARRAFLSQLGWKLSDDQEKTDTLTLPKSFDRVLTGYNEIQRTQGLDLSKYCGKTLTRYTYVVENYPDCEGTVYASLLVYRGCVVGGDISTSAGDGFVRPLDYPR